MSIATTDDRRPIAASPENIHWCWIATGALPPHSRLPAALAALRLHRAPRSPQECKASRCTELEDSRAKHCRISLLS